MINRIIDFSVSNRVIIFVILAGACVAGWWSMKNVPLDAIPDLSDTQVIVYSRWDRSPDIVEDQVTYPIVTAMLGAPRVRAVRGFSDFGYSFVYVIFEDGTDLYWARTRTLEYLSGVLPRLPEGVKTELGPDATGLGWIFQYALVDTSGKRSLADLRSYQDWYLRYYLKSVPGVAEVAPLGGFGRQYQVNLDPNRLQAYRISINRVVKAVRRGNEEVGGRLIKFGGTEYMVRGRGMHARFRISRISSSPQARVAFRSASRTLARSYWVPTCGGALRIWMAPVRQSPGSWSCGRERMPWRSSSA
jgi:Cu(I)/Ag(I) efflux system membrane protein CusA/SilA